MTRGKCESAQVATLEHASGHAHVTSLLAALQTVAPQPPQPPPQQAARTSSAAVTPVRATAWALPQPSEPVPHFGHVSGVGSAAHQQQQSMSTQQAHWSAGSAAMTPAPYAAVAGAGVAHRMPSPAQLAPAPAQQQPHAGPASAEDGAPSAFSAWPHVPQHNGPAAEAAHPMGRGLSPSRQAHSQLEGGRDSGVSTVVASVPAGWPEQPQPQQHAQLQQPPIAAGPAPMARLMIQAAEGAAQLRPPRVTAGKGAHGPVRPLRESTNGNATHPSAARAQAKPSAHASRPASQRDAVN